MDFLRFLGYMAVLLAVVPLAGFCVTGSWRHAWRYTRDWLRVMLGIVIAAAVLFMVVRPMMPF